MSKHIKLSLSVASINELIKKVNSLQDVVNNAKMSAVEEVVKEACEVVKSNTPVDTGESKNSTTYTITSTKATLKQSGDHVFENEFGDGTLGLSSGYPGQRPSGFPTHNDSYEFVPTNPSSKYYQTYKIKKRPLISEGQIAHAQMYKGSLYIRENISKAIKRKVSDALSKI